MDELKAVHAVHGEVTVLEKGDNESLVQLASGEKRTVTTSWLKFDGDSTEKPA